MNIPLTIKYTDESLLYGFTQEVLLLGVDDGQRGRVTLYFPVYETYPLITRQMFADCYLGGESIDEHAIGKYLARGEFIGISFSDAFADNFAGLYRLDDMDPLTFLPIFQNPENPDFLRPYKIASWESALCPPQEQ